MKVQKSMKAATYAELKVVAKEIGIPYVGVPITELKARIKQKTQVDWIEVDGVEPIPETPGKVHYEDNTDDEGNPIPPVPTEVTNENNKNQTKMKNKKAAKAKAPKKAEIAKKAPAKKAAVKKEVQKAELKNLKDYPEAVQKIVKDKDKTKSDKVKELDKKGLQRGEIAHIMDIRYQHVNNILHGPWKKSA